MAFSTQIKIHFDEADPAGIAFSGLVFTKMHRCFEDFIAHLDIPLDSFFMNPEHIYPIRHVETDYLKPLLPLNTYNVDIILSKLSENSFQLEYTVLSEKGSHCVTRSTHVCVEKSSMKKTPIPEKLKQNLEKFASQQ